MSTHKASRSEEELRPLGLQKLGKLYWNFSPAILTEQALARGEGILAANGALVVRTGTRTGRSPRDRFLVSDPAVADAIWWGPVNRPLEPARFERLLEKASRYAEGRELFVFDGFAGADPRYRVSVRIITEKAWHNLFARTLFLRPAPGDLMGFRPDFTILNLSGLKADPRNDGMASEVCIALSFGRNLGLIAGTEYGGEMKKSIFALLNYLLPQQGVFPMHCSANIGPRGDTALFFGLSGTGKTTLSADPGRRLIGDDEHGWSDEGVFNFEGGCYAKTIRLSRDREPQIWGAIKFGSVLENVVVDPVSRNPVYDDASITENTRATYPLDHVLNCEPTGCGPHPVNIVFLTCDAFGVLPPLSQLNEEQAIYHFLSGYTARVAGTEAGVTEPQATFSTCFAAPFLPLPPARYAEMLKEKLQRHQSAVWLLNTGWTGGPAGKADRIPLAYTRAMLNAALSGALDGVAFVPDPIFGLNMPLSCPHVPDELLTPRNAWPDPAAYDTQAKRLAKLFEENMKTFMQTASTSG